MNRDEEMEFDDHDDDQDEEDEDVTLPVQIPPSAAVTGYENSRMKLGGVDSGRKLGGSTSSGLVAPPPSRYRECLKNHAVGIGGHAVDGCGEFMPAGEEGTLDALKCAACNCHRNFHRREVEGSESSSIFHHPSSAGGPPLPPAPLQFSPYYRTPSGYNLHDAAAHRPLRALALPSTSGGHSRDDQDDVSGGGGGSGGERIGKKRYRTKFSQEQKEKMLAFAERVGWRIQKHDEAAVQQFCMETCVKRHVLKVWMHNNKHTLGKKIINTATNMPACL